MEDQAALIGTLFEKTIHFSKTTSELYKLKAIDKSADVISTFTARFAVIVSVTLFFLILNIGIALWIGEALGRSCYGFFIVAGFYGIAGIALYAFRDKWIATPLKNAIIAQAIK